MKFVFAYALAMIAASPMAFSIEARAADYAACNPTALPKSRPDYRIDGTGHLVMDRNNPRVVKAENGENKDTYVVRLSDKPVKNQVQELVREAGQPASLRSYSTDAKGKRVGGGTTRYFISLNGRCALSEVEFQGEDGDGLYGSFVTFNRDFCGKLLKAAEGFSESRADITRLTKLLSGYDNSLQANGRRLFGYSAARMKTSEAADVVASIVGTCSAIPAGYGPIVSAPRAKPAKASGAQDQEESSAGAQ